MEQSDVFSQVNLNVGGKNRQNSLRYFRQQAAVKQKELKKQIVEEIQQKHASPQVSHLNAVNYQPPAQVLKTIENIPRTQDYFQESYSQQFQKFKEQKDTQMTETIIKILENNKKLLNLRALKLKATGIYFGDINNGVVHSKYNTKLRNLNKFQNFKIHKLEDIEIQPSNTSELYDERQGNKPQQFFNLQKKEQEWSEQLKDQSNIIEFQSYQLDILKMKNLSDLREMKDVMSSNNLYLLENKLLLIKVQQLLASFTGEDQKIAANKYISENIQNILQRIAQSINALENTLIDNEVALKTTGGLNFDSIIKSIESELLEMKMHRNYTHYEGSQQYVKHQQQMLEKVRSIEKLRYGEMVNKKAIQNYKIQCEEYETHLKNLLQNKDTSESMKVNLKRIIEMHKTIKQFQDENETILSKNELLNQQLAFFKSETRALNEQQSQKVNQIYQKLESSELIQHPVSKIIKLKDQYIEELFKQKETLDHIIEDNKKNFESKQIDLLMKLEQTQNDLKIFEIKLIEEQTNKDVTSKQNGATTQNFQNEAVQQLSNIVLSKKYDPKTEVDILTKLKQEHQLEKEKMKQEFEEQSRVGILQNKDNERKIQELNQKVEQYLNIAFYLNDLLLEINDLEDYKVIRQKLDSNRENIVKFYGVTSVDFNQSPDISAKRKGKFDMLGKGFVKSFDVKNSPFIDEQFSRISHDSDFIQNIRDLKKRSESNLLNDLHILENMGVQSMSEYMHTRLSKIMQENFELKDENQRFKQVLESMKFERTSGREPTFSKQSPQKETVQGFEANNPEYKLDDIPDNYMYALFMQSITIEEMLKQAEEVQMITNEIEKNQDEQQRLLRESLEFQQQSQKQMLNTNSNPGSHINSNNNSDQDLQKQSYQNQQQQPYNSNDVISTVTTTTVHQYKNLRNSVIQEQSNEDDDFNEQQYIPNSSQSLNKSSSQNQQYPQNQYQQPSQQQMTYSNYNSKVPNNYLFTS